VDDVMSEPIVTVENLSKSYFVGHRLVQGKRYTALRDVIALEARNFVRNASDLIRGRQIVQGDEVEEFWALKNVSFEVKQGEVLGIIGRNGAGKSTLLRILSRITEPTAGRVQLGGRVASLLEVGTGFHPELTGRENIFLNGAILGMTQREIRRKLDGIVAFAEVEQFLDTPVKRYSSGMYVRLAFSVAAHLEPEILIIDEVLAVGDAEFQNKCLGKITDMVHESRTVLFVSHNMWAIKSLTHRCILLKRGSIVALGSPEDVVKVYLTEATNDRAVAVQTRDLSVFRRRPPEPEAKIISIGIGRMGGATDLLPSIELGEELTIAIHLVAYKALRGAAINVLLNNAIGEHVGIIASADCNSGLSFEPGYNLVEIKIGDLPLAPGRYFVDVGLDRSTDEASPCYDVIYNYPLVSVVNTGQVTYWLNRPWGAVHCRAVEWKVARGSAGGWDRELTRRVDYPDEVNDQ
jgi:lipopolysaccharide transport system ATP-binding protein